MHVCFICREYPPGAHGGIGSFTQTLARALAVRGHQVTVVGVYRNLSQRVEENDMGVRVLRLPGTALPRLSFLVNGFLLRRALREIHRATPIDVIDGPEFSLVAIPKNFPATKIIRMNGGHHFFAVTLGKRPRFWRSRLEKRSFRHADELCAVSRFAADTTLELLGYERRALDILPNPVDVQRFQPQRTASEEQGLILFVGTVCEKKGVRQLIQAMPQIIAAVPHARLRIIGRDSRDEQRDESYMEGLKREIPVALKDCIEFSGVIENSELPAALAAAEVCVYPSHMETQGIVIVEAMAMAKAVVATAAGPGAEVVEDNVSGLLCDPHDPRSIAAKTIMLLQDGELRRRLGEAARERAVQMFSIEALVERNEDFYVRAVHARTQHTTNTAPATLASGTDKRSEEAV